MTADQIAKLVFQTDATSASEIVRLHCTGAWTVQGIAQLEQQLKDIAWPAKADLEIDSSAISALDTSGAWLLHRTVKTLEQQGNSVRIIGLRAESGPLLNLISACELLPPSAQSNTGLLASIGKQFWGSLENNVGMLAFVGESAIAMMRLIVQPRRIRWRTIFHNIQIAGFEALPIVGLLSFLMGVVIAYQGADQLQRFGANIYIADMVGLAMLRELSPLLTAIIVAGRSGSAYAAHNRHHEGYRGNRCIADHRYFTSGAVGAAQDDCVDHRIAAVDGVCRCERYNRRHDHGTLQTGCQLRRFHCPSWRCGQLVLCF